MHTTRLSTRFLTAWLLLTGMFAAQAAIVTNITPVNVTPSSFSILCRSTVNVSLEVFADAAGGSNLTSRLGVEAYPIHTGNPDLAAGFPRRQSQIQLRQKAHGFGLVLIQVSNCRPGTAYYYRLSDAPGSYYPASGPLPSVTTGLENSFVLDAQQLLLEIPGLDNLGRIVTLTHTNAAHPLAAVIGDGVGTNQVFFNVNDLFDLATGGNLAPLGNQPFAVNVWGPGGTVVSAQFTLNFTLNFTVAQANLASIGAEFLALRVGSAVLQTGQSTNIPILLTTSDGLSALDLTLVTTPGRLTNLNLTALSPEIDPAAVSVTVQSASNLVLHLPARSGQVIAGSKAVAQFAFQGTPGQPSAFVPLTINQVTASRPDNSVLTNLTLASGRLVIVGNESLLEAGVTTNGGRTLTLYAKPNFSYALEYATNVAAGAEWTRLRPLAITQLATPVAGVGDVAPIFYRAVEFNADPPYLEAHRNPDGSRFLTLFGKPGSGYTIESTGAVGGPPAWASLTNVALSSSFTNVPVSGPGTVFFRAGELFASSPRLNLVRNPDGSADATLFGRAGYAYYFQSAPTGNPNSWTNLQRVILDQGFLSLHLTNVSASLLRAVDYQPDPSVLELAAGPDGKARLHLFGKPGGSYRVESTSTLGPAASWNTLFRVPLATSYTNLTTLPMTQNSAFFRAAEFTTDPPLLEALLNPNGTRQLRYYGQPSRSYTIEYCTNLSGSSAWYPLITNAPGGSFGYVAVTNTPSPIFYRLQRN